MPTKSSTGFADPLGDRLRDTYEVSVPASIEADMRRRLAEAISGALLGRSDSLRPRTFAKRHRVFMILGLAAVLATLGAMPVIRFFDGWDGTFDRVFELSTPIGLSVTDSGYRVTLVRAYGDEFSVRLAIAGEDLQDRGGIELNVIGAIVSDDAGRVYSPVAGSYQQPSPETSESWLRMAVPPDERFDLDRRLTVTFDSIAVRRDPAPTLSNGEIDLDHVWTTVKGTWAFEFDLRFFRARTARPDVTSTVGDVAVTFDELSVTPAATVGRLTFAGLPHVDPSWGWDPYLRVDHDGSPLDLEMLAPGFVQDQLTFEAVPGFWALDGGWTITIDEFRRTIPDPAGEISYEQVSITGPWILTFVAR